MMIPRKVHHHSFKPAEIKLISVLLIASVDLLANSTLKMNSFYRVACLLLVLSSVLAYSEDLFEFEPRGYGLSGLVSGHGSGLIHGLLGKLSGTLKNIFKLHRTKLNGLHGGLDDVFHRILTIQGKSKEYSGYSCKCPGEPEIMEYLRKYPVNLGANMKLFKLIPLWGQIARLEGMIHQNQQILRSYVYVIRQLEGHVPANHHYRSHGNLTKDIENFVNSIGVTL